LSWTGATESLPPSRGNGRALRHLCSTAAIPVLLLTGGSTRSALPRRTPIHPPAAPCPAAVPHTRALVEKFLTSDAHASSRQETGTAGVSTSEIRLLTDAADAAACWRLNDLLGGAGTHGSWVWSYYAAGGRYFVAMQYVDPADTERIGWVPVLVYDQGFNRVGAYAM
jgi:hypothetical protein